MHLLNLKSDVPDMGERFGYAPNMEARFAREPLKLEVYVVLGGSARVKLDDEILELKPMDAVRIPVSTMRGFEAGADGAEILAIGAPDTHNEDIEMDQQFWPAT